MHNYNLADHPSCINTHSFWGRTACGAYSGFMGGLAVGAIITVVSSNAIPVFIGMVSGVFVGSIGGICWHTCSEKADEDNDVYVREGGYDSTVERSPISQIRNSL